MAYSDFTLSKFKKSFSIRIDEGNEIRKIYGAVTTGDIWKFLKLEKNDIFIDLSNYYIKEIDKILGILSQSVQGDMPGLSSTN